MFAEVDILEYANWFDMKIKNKDQPNVELYLKEVGTKKLMREPGYDITKVYIMITEGMCVKYDFNNSIIDSFSNLSI